MFKSNTFLLLQQYSVFLIIGVVLVAMNACERAPNKGFSVHGVEDGYRRNLGKGFYMIDVRVPMPTNHWEAYYWRRDLYFKDLNIDRASTAAISPSGRFAVYESFVHSGIVLFDTKILKKYRVIDHGVFPQVLDWKGPEEIFVMEYRALTGERVNITVDVKSLKMLQENERVIAPR